MLSLRPRLESQDRPFGVTAIVGLCAVASVLACLFLLLLIAQRIPLSAGAWFVGGGLEQLGPLIFLLYAVIFSVLGVALWRRWKGARRIGIFVAAAGVALAVPAISSAVVDERLVAVAREAVQIIARVIVIFYLSQEPVREWFASKGCDASRNVIESEPKQ